ncbi:hypothetical protein QTN25_004063 [Entamoeba marina]
MNDRITYSVNNMDCDYSYGWDVIDFTFFFTSNPFVSGPIIIECNISQNLTIISALNYAQFNLHLPNSTVTIIFDSIDQQFTTTVLNSSSIIADKSIPVAIKIVIVMGLLYVILAILVIINTIITVILVFPIVLIVLIQTIVIIAKQIIIMILIEMLVYSALLLVAIVLHVPLQLYALHVLLDII